MRETLRQNFETLSALINAYDRAQSSFELMNRDAASAEARERAKQEFTQHCAVIKNIVSSFNIEKFK
jgi:hypothetical protein